MKTKLLSLLLFSISYLSISQTTAIPDTNFEQALIDLGIDSDGIINGQILTSDAESVTGEPGLYLANKNISDLTGIEAFVNAFDLECQNNNLTNLDISNLQNLFYFNCSNNNLSSLNVKNGQNDNLPDHAFNALNNPNLTCIQVDDANYSNNNWNNIDGGVSFSESCSSIPTTDIPDSNFEQALIDLNIDSDGIINGKVFTADISNITYLNVSYKSISNLTGIEDFAALNELYCQGNNLTTLNFESNTQLKKLHCYSNNLSAINLNNNSLLEEANCNNNSILNIDISNNTLLKEFQISGSRLTSIDISNNGLLEVFSCSANQITTLDLSNNTNLITLDCYFNEISTLNISNNLQLKTLKCGSNNLNSLNISNHSQLEELDCSRNIIQTLDISNNNLLKVLWVDSNQLTTLDISNNTSLEVLGCQNNQLTSLNVEAHVNLKELLFAVNQITTIDVTNNTLLERFQCQINQLNSLDISNNTLLNDFNCGGNQLSSIDVSNNTLLDIFWCADNQLTDLDVSNNLQLSWLNCGENQLEYLELSNNTMLESIECYNNQLTYLNVKNGNNASSNYFNTANNPNLACITVDDPTYSTTNWTNIDSHTSFSEDCGIVWTSNSNDYESFTAIDTDGDTFSWKTQNGNISAKGLVSSTSFFSESYNSATNTPLSPDNSLITPTGEITIPNNVSSITFKLNVEASSAARPAEHFAVYVFDEALGQSFDNKIHEETLTVGGSGTAKDVTASIPVSFAGKNIGIIIRHYNTIGQDKLYVDDFEISYEASTLSSKVSQNLNFNLYPNPTKDYLFITSKVSTSFTLTNINGQVLKQGIIDKGANNINLSYFKNGLYFLNLKTNSGTLSKKILKK